MDKTPHPNLDPQLLEAMEACRPNSGDLAEPEMAPLRAALACSPRLQQAANRLERLDAVLSRAFVEAPVPAGLCQRILAKIAESEAEAAGESGPWVAATAAPGTATATTTAPGTVAVGARRRRRRVLRAAVAAAMAASILVALGWYYWHRPASLTSEQACLDGISYYDRDSHSGGRLWTPTAADEAHSFPLSRLFVAYPRPIRWRAVEGFLDRGGVAYDLVGVHATLYVVRASVARVGEEPTWPPIQTAQRCASAWQEGDFLYVLVVEGEPEDYRQLLVPTQSMGPVA